MFDLSAAFDTVNHTCLLATLEELGGRETGLLWFQAYLSNRQQKINVRGTHSRAEELTCDVLQGSALGPILFNIYPSSIRRILREQ